MTFEAQRHLKQNELLQCFDFKLFVLNSIMHSQTFYLNDNRLRTQKIGVTCYLSMNYSLTTSMHLLMHFLKTMVTFMPLGASGILVHDSNHGYVD